MNQESKMSWKTPNLNWINFDQLFENPEKYAKNLSIDDLEKLIETLKNYYYNTSEPLVPDYIYDELEDTLRDRKPDSKILLTVDASVAVAHGTMVTLPYFMGSQDKAKLGDGRIANWKKRNTGPYVISHKLDGISAMFIWKRDRKAKLKLYTRGRKGDKGQDITRIAKYIDLGKYHFDKDKGEDEIAIRGELIVPQDIWEKHYAHEKHVRNWVAGMVNHKTLQSNDLKQIKFVAYELIHPEMKPSQQFKKLTDWNFYTSPNWIAKNKSELTEPKLKLQLQNAEDHGPYEIDGLVIANDSIPTRTTDKYPKYSIAFKMQLEGDEAQTKVIGVEWNPSKDGLLKPVVLIEPVDLSGATLSRATAHNAKYVVDNNIGIGAKITIIRSGKVIPYIKSVDRPAPKVHLPVYDHKWHTDGINFILKDINKEVYHKVLVHMTKHLEIDHLGPGVLKKLVDLGYYTPTQILTLEMVDLERVESLGKNAEKIYNSLQNLKTRGVRLAVMMDASNIFDSGIGTRIMQLVLDHIPDLLERNTRVFQLKKDLVDIKGVQEKTAQKIIDGLEPFKAFLQEIPEIRIKEFSDSDSYSDSMSDDLDIIADFDGLRVIFTGVRDKDLEALIKASGGDVANGISKTFKGEQVVVAKDPSASSNKLKVARDLGLSIYNLSEFKEHYGVD